jgi:THO complex subunit 4
MKEFFGRVGTVSNVFIKYDKAGRPEGRAFITFEESSGASDAVKRFNGVTLKDLPIIVEELGLGKSRKFSDNYQPPR